MRILLTGGGSGGHVFPLLAVARKLIMLRLAMEQSSSGQASSPESGTGSETLEFLFIGPDAFSKQVMEREGIRSKVIITGKLRRYFSFSNFFDLVKLPIAFAQSFFYLFFFMPDIIFAKGGYGSFPVVLVGWLFRIPIVIHESDIVPGLANRLMARIAKKVFISFGRSVDFFPPAKTMLLGNPIRERLFKEIPQNPRTVLGLKSAKPIVFILGGSQGAREINDTILLALPDFVKKYEIIHQTGEKNLDMIKKAAFVQLPDKEMRDLYHTYGILTEEELSCAFADADVIISRAGSGAIFEIAASGKPSVLIPYMAAAGNHQLRNAQIYTEHGAGDLLFGKNVTPHMVINAVDAILEVPGKKEAMSRAARDFAKPDAAWRMAEEIIRIVS